MKKALSSARAFFFITLHYNLSCTSWHLLNTEGLQVSAYYAEFKKAFPSSVIFYDRGIKGILLSKKLPYKSHYALKSIIDLLISKGMLKEEMLGRKRILRIESKTKSAERYAIKEKTRRQFIKLNRSEEIKPQLAAAMLRSKIKKIRFAHYSGTVQNKKSNLLILKKKCDCTWGFSTGQLAKLWSVSKSTARRILSQISQGFGIFFEKPEKKALMLCTAKKWEDRHTWWNKGEDSETYRCHLNSCFWYRGMIFYQSKLQIGIG